MASSNDVFQFLGALPRPKDSQDASLGGMGRRKGKWLVPDDKYEEFMDLVHTHLFINNNSPLNIVEQPRKDKEKPLLVDLDFKFPITKNLDHINPLPGRAEELSWASVIAQYSLCQYANLYFSPAA